MNPRRDADAPVDAELQASDADDTEPSFEPGGWRVVTLAFALAIVVTLMMPALALAAPF